MLRLLPRRTSLRTPLPASVSSSTLQSRPDTLQQCFVVERFCHELHCACSQRLHPHFFVAMCRDEDDRNPATFGVHLRLRSTTAHPRHPHIPDHTSNLFLLP